MQDTIFIYKTVFRILLAAAPSMLHAQQPVLLPAPYIPSSVKINYIRTWEAKAPEQDPDALTGRPLRDVQQTTQYFDGLGRSLQTVVKEGSMLTGNSPTDLVSPVIYDGFGRQVYQYLPFASDSSNGLFKPDPFQQQVSFYNTLLA
ncbi:MAG TPA: DUF6443 domain-containing protein, partial [Agriterribacter sp.]|nr:DUF6443 domain-containing protein [Agriterribacter sp.]